MLPRCVRFPILALILTMTSAALAQAPAQSAKPATLEEGQKVQVREGDTWSPATIVKREGRRYQIRYEGTNEEEWVAADRIRGVAADAPANQSDAPRKDAQPKPPAIPNWAQGSKAEVKWGGLWFEVSIVNRRGEWYLIEYTRDKSREWVEYWRIRKIGDTTDAIGHARPNGRWRAGDNPPREKAGEPPEPIGASPRSAEQKKAMEQFKQDAAFKEADLEGVKDLELPGFAADSKIAADPAPAAKPARPIRFAGASGEFFESMKNLVIGRGGNFAAVIHENAPPGKEAQSKLERLDLAGGKSAGVFALASNMVLFDISADGKLVAVRNDEFGFGNNTRLEIWALDGNQIKKVLILFPYEKESWGPDRDITHAWLLDNSSLLTLNPKGNVILWNIATGKGIYRAKINDQSRPAISGGGKQMALEVDKSVVIVEPLSGAVLGALSLQGRTGLTYSFSPSGKQLAGWAWQNVYAWDLTTGKMFREFTVAAGSGEFAMVADGYALVDHHILIDFERRIPLWNYQAGGRSVGVVAPGGTLWYSIKGGREEPTPLTPLKVPTNDALAAANTLKADDLLLLKPGVKVALSMNVDVQEADGQAIKKSLQDQLTQARLVLDDTSPIRIVASSEPGKTREVEYRPIGAGPFAPPQKVSVTPMITKLVVEVDGKPAWQTTSIAGAGFFLSVKEGQTIEQAVAEASKVNVQFLKNVKVPVYLTKPREPAWYGSSKL
jgi:hypothetical protein